MEKAIVEKKVIIEKKVMNREAILLKAKNNTLDQIKVFISDWDCEVIVRELSGKQYIDLSLKATKKDIMNREKFLNYAIISSTYDLENKKIFEFKDVGIFSNMGADSFSTLITAITVLNNLGDDEDKNKSKNS